MPPVNIWPRLREVLRDEGPGGLIIRAARKTRRAILQVERVAFYDTDLTQPFVGLRPLPVAVEFIVATPDDLLNRYEATLETDFGVEPRDVEQRLARSHIALLGLHQGVVISMLWLAFDAQRVSEIGRTMVLHPGEILTYNAVTVPAWRGCGVSPHLSLFALHFAMQHGARRHINWRRLGNAPAIRVAAKLGDRLLAVVTAVRLLGIQQPLVFGTHSAQLLPRLQCP